LKGRREDYVFTNKGKKLTTIQKSFDNAVRRAGIRRCRFHDLRHPFATELALGGVDLVTVKELMGHADIKVTMRYAHPTPESRRRAVDLLVGGDETSRSPADGVLGEDFEAP
jgi:site-specific recombinase XerD